MLNIRGGDCMYRFTNTTTKENFLKSIEWSGNKIKPAEAYGKNQKAWNVIDKFGNEWNILFTGNVDEYSIFNVPHHPCDKPFKVDIVSSGNKIEIHRAEKNGRCIKADRLLKEFTQLALMVNCYIQFGYMKI